MSRNSKIIIAVIAVTIVICVMFALTKNKKDDNENNVQENTNVPTNATEVGGKNIQRIQRNEWRTK